MSPHAGDRVATLWAAHQREAERLFKMQHAEMQTARESMLAELVALAERIESQKITLTATEQRLEQARAELQLAVDSRAALAAALEPLIRSGLLSPASPPSS